MKKIILLGAGGHASVVLNVLLQNNNIKIVGFTDSNYSENNTYKSYPIIGTDNILEEVFRVNIADHAFITVGSTGDNVLRQELFNKIKSIGFKSLNIIHNKTIISKKEVQLGQGNFISAGVVINPDVEIGNNNIINTGSIIEHGCYIGNHIHIAPGAVLAGNVCIGDLTHIGLGAKAIEGVTIGKNCLIGAGAVIINDIPDNSVVVGIPGKIVRKRGGLDDN